MKYIVHPAAFDDLIERIVLLIPNQRTTWPGSYLRI
jgi:hypothetical protein